MSAATNAINDLLNEHMRTYSGTGWLSDRVFAAEQRMLRRVRERVEEAEATARAENLTPKRVVGRRLQDGNR